MDYIEFEEHFKKLVTSQAAGPYLADDFELEDLTSWRAPIKTLEDKDNFSSSSRGGNGSYLPRAVKTGDKKIG